METELKYQKYTAKDYKSENAVRWCPGCGDHAILSCLYKAMAELNIEPHQTAVISGIGCSSVNDIAWVLGSPGGTSLT